MKKCSYCGRENAEEATHCPECGTELAPPVDQGPTPCRNRTWLEWLGPGLCWAALLWGIGLAYLLSFGPVNRYCGRTLSQTATPVTVATNGYSAVLTSVRTVSYPGWVGVVYRPVLRLRGNGFYARYLEWWEERSR